MNILNSEYERAYVRAFARTQSAQYHVTEADGQAVAKLRQGNAVDVHEFHSVASGVLGLGRMAGSAAFTLTGFCKGWPGFRAKAGTSLAFHVEHDARALYKVRMDECDHEVAEAERYPTSERASALLASRKAARQRLADRGWEAFVNEVKSRKSG